MIQTTQPLGDSAILLTFGSQIDTAINKEIVSYVATLKKTSIEGVLEVISGYTTITIQYDFFKVSYEELKEKLQVLTVEKELKKDAKVVEIPVCYEMEFSKDMEEVMSFTGLTRKEIIHIHTSKEYLVYMLGFTPGFFYLGGMDSRLFCPRKEKPRLKIAAGDVGIAGGQTGVYSVDSPGGWQIIGKTPFSIFDKKRKDNHFLVNQGDTVRFVEISLEEFKSYQND